MAKKEAPNRTADGSHAGMSRKEFERELAPLQLDLVKLSPLDLHARTRWVDYSRAKDLMVEHTSTPESPWHEVDADFERRARLNCIAHLLSLVPYEDVTHPRIELPARQTDPGWRRPPKDSLNWIPTPH
jgi:hypothetical protein